MSDESVESLFPKKRTYAAVAVALFCGLGVLIIMPHKRSDIESNDIAQLSVKSSSSTKPHIIFLLSDDLAWNSMGYQDYDLTFVTPELTALAADGITMTNYYAMEFCNPSRASLLTGRYPVNMGIQYGVVSADLSWGLRLEETLLPEVLKDEGYKTYMLGKWHLGHFNEKYLPTARGFETYTGYLDGQNNYYSKRDNSDPTFKDFMTSDTDCYYSYNGPNLHNYSTHLYQNLAIDSIYSHDQSNPMFMYLAFQAVHVPFVDISGRGVNKEFMEDSIYEKILDDVVGVRRQQYAMALNIMDTAVKNIKTALSDVGMLDNTYIIFASDNGGCYLGGGKNYPYRGTKFTMLEGGTKVDAFIYSPLISSSLRGSNYSGLFHVSDWFPTILDLADITYSTDDDYALDGVSQVSAWKGDTDTNPRSTMLYNSYTNAKYMDFDMWSNGCFAVRNDQYKLIHFYDGDYADWFSIYEEISDDDSLSMESDNCDPYGAMDGTFTYALFDLLNDPYETTNLYDSTEDAHVTAKTDLYALVDEYNTNSVESLYDSSATCKQCKKVWKDAGDYVMPWVTGDKGKISVSGRTYPSYCGTMTENAITTAGDDDDSRR